VIEYVPAFNDVTFDEPFLSEIVKLGPTVPFSFVTELRPVAPAATARASAAAAATKRIFFI
jgi:hypothetical protein